MLKLNCGWELPDELELVVDVISSDGFNGDDLVSIDKKVLVTINHREEVYFVEVYEDRLSDEHDYQIKVADYKEFLESLAEHGYAPAKSVIRSYKLDRLLTEE